MVGAAGGGTVVARDKRLHQAEPHRFGARIGYLRTFFAEQRLVIPGERYQPNLPVPAKVGVEIDVDPAGQLMVQFVQVGSESEHQVAGEDDKIGARLKRRDFSEAALQLRQVRGARIFRRLVALEYPVTSHEHERVPDLMRRGARHRPDCQHSADARDSQRAEPARASRPRRDIATRRSAPSHPSDIGHRSFDSQQPIGSAALGADEVITLNIRPLNLDQSVTAGRCRRHGERCATCAGLGSQVSR